MRRRQSRNFQKKKSCQIIRLANTNILSTLSSAILRLERNPPTLDSRLNYEIVGDKVHQLEKAPLSPANENADENDDENAEKIDETLATLPRTGKIDAKKHFFLKKSKCVSEDPESAQVSRRITAPGAAPVRVCHFSCSATTPNGEFVL